MPTVISSFRSEAQRARVSVASAILLIAISVFGCSDRRSGSPLVPQDDVGGSFGSDNSPTDAHADETPSEPPLEEFGCVSDWPTQEPVALVPSLDLPRYSVVGVDKPPNKYGWRDLVFSGGSIASLSIGALVSYDVAARTFVQFAGLGRSCAVSSQPAIRRDTLRGFVSGCHGVVGLHPDFGVTPESSWGFSIQWSFTLDSNKNPYTEVTEVSTMLADPGGNLYFAATDDTFRAIRADDGAAVWTRGVQHDYRYTAYANARVGIGDRLFFGMSSVFKRDTGIQIASIKVDGKPVSVLGATYSGKLVGEVRAEGSDSASLVVLDQCGNLQWSWGNALGYMVLVGFDESLLVGEYNIARIPVFYRFSIDGALIAGPSKFGNKAVAMALGADGVLYLSASMPNSEHRNDGTDLELIAVSPELEVLDRLNLGFSGDEASAVLLDDGLMILRRDGVEGAEYLRIQTASPGLARTAWPTIRRDNERTGWVAPW